MGFRLANVAGRAALVAGDHYFDLATVSSGSLSSDPMKALLQPERLSIVSTAIGDQRPTGAVDDTVLGPPVPHPQKVFGVGLNYRDHAAEGGRSVPEHPLVFTKFPSCLAGPTDQIELRSDRCDYEGELVVVIGEGGKDIAPGDAWTRVLGVMVGQDVSDRKVQFSTDPPHFDLGKSFDTFGPTGPVLVSLDEIGDPGNLRIVTRINREERQNDITGNMIFDVPTLVSYLSRITTLVTGDLIFTGTPAGVGAARRQFLADGDLIETTIGGIGTMINRCVRVSDFEVAS